MTAIAQFALELVYGGGALAGLFLALAYGRDATSWYQVMRSGKPVVRPANVDQVLFMLSFSIAGVVALFAAVLHIEKFGLTLRALPLAATSAIMILYAAWFGMRRYFARPVIKLFGINAGKHRDGALLLQAGDRARIRTESWMISGATLHGLGDWRAERGAASRISAEVAASLASRAGAAVDSSVNPTRGLTAALVGLVAPLGLMAVLLALLAT